MAGVRYFPNVLMHSAVCSARSLAGSRMSARGQLPFPPFPPFSTPTVGPMLSLTTSERFASCSPLYPCEKTGVGSSGGGLREGA
eukprot:5448987-Pyramimonas_sp.AAC.1